MQDLQTVADRLAVAEVACRYAQAVDLRDWDGVGACFGEGSTIQGTEIRAPRDTYLAELEVAVERFERTMHFVGNQIVDLDGDRAHLESYAVAYHFAHDAGDPDLIMGVRYRDELARHGDRWLIAQRTVVADWADRDGKITIPPR